MIPTPTLAQPPAPAGALRDDADPAREFHQPAFTPFTPLYNATGQAQGHPAAVLVQAAADRGDVGGRYGDEATLISLSAQLEAARPWATASRCGEPAGAGRRTGSRETATRL